MFTNVCREIFFQGVQHEVVWKTFQFSTGTVLSQSSRAPPRETAMMFFISALAFFLLLSVLILIHEWGHYSAAKFFGVIVEEFGFGLPPKAKKLFRRDGTDFTVNWIPFGGFVRLKGENAMTEKERRAKGSFSAASVGARSVILLAGVIMNLLLAVVILTIGFSVGRWVPTYISYEDMKMAGERGEISVELGVMIDEVVGGDSAALAGVPSHSIIRSIDGQQVREPDDVPRLQEGKNRVVYSVSRVVDGSVLEEIEQYRVPLVDGKSGVVIMPYTLELSAPERSLFSAVGLAFREAWVMTQQTVVGIGNLFGSLFQTGRVPEGIAGIVGIAQLTHGAVQEGFMHYLRLVALLSLSLAALNVLPFPALDGGRLIFVLAEGIFGKPMNRTFEVTVNACGFVFLILLIIVITFNDIIRLF